MRKSVAHGMAIVVSTAIAIGAAAWLSADQPDPRQMTFADDTGTLRSFNTAGPLDTGSPFFQSLGTNGRACVTCHQAADAWTVTPAHLRERFTTSRGLDPIFQSNDGSNCEGAVPTSLTQRRAASSLLLNKGLIRVGLTVPVDAEFTVVAVDDPYRCGGSLDNLSLYRRVLPSTNLAFLSTVMWDGRETRPGVSIVDNLKAQARDATLGHAQATLVPTDAEIEAIVSFETGLFTAQATDYAAGSLHADGALGGPAALSRQAFFLGINDPLGGNPTGAAFDPHVFTLFAPWMRSRARSGDEVTDARAAIARGEALFNTRPIVITGVAGLNDNPKVGASFSGSCTTCHDTPNSGNHSVSAPLNIGISDASIRTPDLPLYTVRHKLTGAEILTSDPGRAMISGKWTDVGKFKGPILRGLAGRAPYFHNGSAATLDAAVDFYNTRFRLGLTMREKSDLIAFLRAI
jgi:cytochrome c peroxidase